MIPHFTHPWLLVLLIIPTLLLRAVWKRYGGEVALPFDHGQFSSGRRWQRVIQSMESIPAMLLGMSIVLLAGPQETGEPKTQRSLSNIQFCVDVSGSMTAAFGSWTRYEASMHAIEDFVKARQGDAFGLTFFSDIALQWTPLTTDTSAIAYALPFMDPRRPLPQGLGGGTRIANAIEECRQTLLSREAGDRMIILVSDGASADLSGGAEVELAAKLKKDGIVLFDIHIEEGEVPGEIVALATQTDGAVFQPGDDEGFAAVFRRIDAMQKTKLEKIAAESRDHFLPWVLVGLSLLGCATLAGFGLRYTPW